jgi:hypothetical protein
MISRSDGTVAFVASGNNRVCIINGSNVVTVAGNGVAGTSAGPALSSSINWPQDVTEANGTLFVAANHGDTINVINGMVTCLGYFLLWLQQYRLF